jgi:hypothetical protein
VRLPIHQRKDEWHRLGAKYGVQWTPGILVIDSRGEERHRIEGFLPADDLIAQLTLGLGHSAFERRKFDEAQKRFESLVDHSNPEIAAEALYWAGVARYKATDDAAALKDTAREFDRRYTDTSWAKRASVWPH